jgi:predicted ATPase/transcriptional regulator with XRE-family HTH domain
MESRSSSRFGQLLKQLRARHDLTQDALAELAGCAVYTIRTYEMGTRRPSREMAEQLVRVLHLEGEAQARFLQLARAPRDTADALAAPEATPALSLPVRPTSLPVPLTSLVGRTAELATVGDLLRDPACRLLTILGPGGSGKTRLALEVARNLARDTAEAVIWVELAPITAVTQLPAAIAAALGAPPADATNPLASLREVLRSRQVLLVLDNLEQLLNGAMLLADLLREAPDVRILATSRERLHIASEWVYELDGLSLPPDGPAGARADAVQLFLVRARQVDHTFALNPENLPTVARICRLLGGSPLGIELAAAWVRLLPWEVIADEIEHNLDFLTHRGRDIPKRHRSLRSVFTYSWELLAPAERAALARLSVLRGTWDLETARIVAGAEPATLAALADAALVRRAASDAAGRFTLHELVRQYAAEQLDADPIASAATVARHAAHFAERLRGLVRELQSGAQPLALARLSPDLDDVWGAWSWAVQQRNVAALLEMARGIVTLCEDLGRLADGQRLLGEAVATLEGDGQCSRETLGELRSWYGYFLGRCGRAATAEAQLHDALATLPPEAQGARSCSGALGPTRLSTRAIR